MNASVLGSIFLAVLIATFPVFRLRSGTVLEDRNVAGRPASALLGFWIRHWMVWVLSPLEGALVRSGISPDVLNLLGLAGGVGAAVAFAFGDAGLAAWLLSAGGICDILDGRVARARGIASRYGAFVDSTLDRFAETATLIGLGWYLRGSGWTMIPLMLALSGSLLVSYTRARGEALGVRFAGGLMQRAERVVVLIVAALAEAGLSRRLGWPPHAILGTAVVLIGVGTMGTAVYRAVVIGRSLRRESPDG